jgi:hypothetical protein
MQEKVFLKWLKNICDMRPESEKYKKVLNILRESTPTLNSTVDIEREVMSRISNNRQRLSLPDLMDFFFGWVYIRWVRRTLIIASFLLVAVFVYQQGIILKQINYMSRQTILVDGGNESANLDVVQKKLMIYKLTRRKLPSKYVTISEKEMQELLESVKELQIKYKDLLDLIDEDPQLKKYIEEKFIENNKVKTKL